MEWKLLINFDPTPTMGHEKDQPPFQFTFVGLNLPQLGWGETG